MSKLTTILNADIERKYTGDAVSLVQDARTLLIYEKNNLLAVLLYTGALINISLFIISLLVIRKTAMKFFGKNLLVVTFLSSIFLIFTTYMIKLAL